MNIDFPRLLELTEGTYVRELGMDDLKVINKWHNSTELYNYLVGSCHYPSIEKDVEWINDGIKKENLYRGVIYKSSKPIGVVYLTRENYDTITFEIFIANESERGKGTGSIVCSSVIKTLFAYDAYTKIVLSVLASNERAIKLYKKCGFNIVAKSKVMKDNNIVDIYNMAISKKDC